MIAFRTALRVFFPRRLVTTLLASWRILRPVLPGWREFSDNIFTNEEEKVMQDAKNMLKQEQELITTPKNYQEWVNSIEPRLRGDTPVVIEMFANWSSPC